jgi:cytochrome c oxidase assembly factor CtaG
MIVWLLRERVVGGWSLDPLVITGLALTVWLFVRGEQRIRGRGPDPGRRWRVVSFTSGVAAVVVALCSPVSTLAHRLLSMHMVQHLVLMLAAAPLLVLARPALPVWAGLTPAIRRVLLRGSRTRPARTMTSWVTAPPVAWLLHVSVVWAWHAPGPYDAAVRIHWVHALEHAAFLGTALLWWWVALQPGRHRRLARGGDVLFVLAAWIQSGALGALLTFASSPIYPVYAGAGALRDQQIAGLLMWIPAGVVYLAAASILFVEWLRRTEEQTRAVEARLTGTAAAGGARVIGSLR